MPVDIAGNANGCVAKYVGHHLQWNAVCKHE
jgi:hypothetical protein